MSGTHLSNTAEAEAFAIIAEESVAKGVRRIVAFTRGKALEAIALGAKFEAEIAAAGRLEGAEVEKVKAR